MATHDYVIANGTGASVRSDLNDALAAIVSQNSSATAPATTYAYMPWADTTAGLMKMRNGANSGWITLYQLDGEWTSIALENGTAAAPSVYFKDSGTDTGIYSSGTDAVDIATAGVRRFGVGSTGDVTVYGGNVTLNTQGDLRFADADSSNWVAFQAPATVASNVTWTLPSADGTSGQLLSTNGSGTLSWASSASQWTTSGSNIYYNTGRVGIGTTGPSDPLHVLSSGGTAKIDSSTNGGSASLLFDVPAANGLRASGGNRAKIACEHGASGWDSSLVFYVGDNGGGTTTEKARIDTAGRLLVGISSANTAGARLQTSNGLTFPATQVVSTDPNTLDDYEEGTFTPTVEGGTTAGTATYSTRTGTYVKVGKVVFIYVGLTWTGGTGTGNMKITGLPFTPTDFSSVSYALVDNLAATANYVPLMATIHTNGGIFPMQALVGGNTPANSGVPYDAAATMYFSGHYPAA